jgi:ubiquinone/menaquinone biosynthesis C-methylase UbiE
MTERIANTALQVRGLFDAKAAAWPSKYVPGGRLAGRLARLAGAVTDHVPVGGNVLDLGCGTGELAISLATSGMRATGCDISPEMLRIAAKTDGSSQVVDWVELEANWRVLPFRAGAFDAVVASSVLEYVDEPVAVLRECHRVLRPGGIVLCTVPDPRHPMRWLEWLADLVAQWRVVRAAGRPWPRLDAYLTYLDISQQRHFPRWWHATAALAGLLEVRYPSGSAERSPLSMLTFRRASGAMDKP